MMMHTTTAALHSPTGPQSNFAVQAKAQLQSRIHGQYSNVRQSLSNYRLHMALRWPQQRRDRQYMTNPIASAAQHDGAQDTEDPETPQSQSDIRQRGVPKRRKRPTLFSGVPEQPEQPTTAAGAKPAVEQASILQSTHKEEQQQQQQHEQQDMQSMPDATVLVQHQQSTQQLQEDWQQQQQQQQDATGQVVTSPRQLFVFWDLDNKHPSEWLQMPEVIQNLKEALQPFGSICSISSYSNINTLTWVVPGHLGGGDVGSDDLEVLEDILPAAALAEMGYRGPAEAAVQSDCWGLEILEDEIMAQDEDLRCPLCGRRCKSIEDRNKHFLKLHKREHQKKLGSGRQKHTQKYLNSDKAQRYREAVHDMALPISNLSGRKGQRVKLLLRQYGVTLKEVNNTRQAVDIMMKEHITHLASTLRSHPKEQEPPTQKQPQVLSRKAAKAKQATQRHNIGSAVMADSVLVLVTDDRGFRDTAAHWLRGDGAGVILVTNREPEEWDAKWIMSQDQRLRWVYWYGLI